MRSGRLQEATEEENSKTSLEQMTPRGQTRGLIKIILRPEEPAGYVWREEEVAQAGEKYL